MSATSRLIRQRMAFLILTKLAQIRLAKGFEQREACRVVLRDPIIKAYFPGEAGDQALRRAATSILGSREENGVDVYLNVRRYLGAGTPGLWKLTYVCTDKELDILSNVRWSKADEIEHRGDRFHRAAAYMRANPSVDARTAFLAV